MERAIHGALWAAMAIAFFSTGVAHAQVGVASDPRLEAMRLPDAAVLELRLPRDYDDDAHVVTERVVPTQYGQAFNVVDQRPFEDGTRLTLAPGRYRMTTTAGSSMPAFIDLEVRATEVVSYGVRPGERVVSDAMMIAGCTVGGIAVIVGYFVLLAGVAESGSSFDGDDGEGVMFLGLGMMVGGIALAVLSFALHESHEDPRAVLLARAVPDAAALEPVRTRLGEPVPPEAVPSGPGVPVTPPGYGESLAPPPVAPAPAPTAPAVPTSSEIDALPALPAPPPS